MIAIPKQRSQQNNTASDQDAPKHTRQPRWPSMQQAVAMGGGLLALGCGLPLAQARQMLQAPPDAGLMPPVQPLSSPPPPVLSSPPPPPDVSSPPPVLSSPPPPDAGSTPPFLSPPPPPVAQNPPQPEGTQPLPPPPNNAPPPQVPPNAAPPVATPPVAAAPGAAVPPGFLPAAQGPLTPQQPFAPGPAIASGSGSLPSDDPLKTSGQNLFRIVSWKTGQCLNAQGVEPGGVFTLQSCLPVTDQNSIFNQQFSILPAQTDEQATDTNYAYNVVTYGMNCLQFDNIQNMALARQELCGTSAQQMNFLGQHPTVEMLFNPEFDVAGVEVDVGATVAIFGPRANNHMCATAQDAIVGTPFWLQQCQGPAPSPDSDYPNLGKFQQFLIVPVPPVAQSAPLPQAGDRYVYKHVLSDLCLTLDPTNNNRHGILDDCTYGLDQMFTGVATADNQAWTLRSGLTEDVTSFAAICLSLFNPTDQAWADSCAPVGMNFEEKFARVNLIPAGGYNDGRFVMRFGEQGACLEPQNGGFKGAPVFGKACDSLSPRQLFKALSLT